MEQQYSVDRGPADLEPPASPASAEEEGAASTVVAEGEWLAVSTEGFSEQQHGRPLAHLVKELVQNALDSVGAAGRIDLAFMSTGPRRRSCAAPATGRAPRT